MVFKMTEDEFFNGNENYEGLCLSCRDKVLGVEPDACNYECESCGEKQVFGLQELLTMGELEILE